MIEIVVPEEAHWKVFEGMARKEGWRIPQWEIGLYRGPWRQSAFVLLDQGVPCGFVTAVSFGGSGWIGNLIVDSDCRGRGFGGMLFDHAVDYLGRQGDASIWLTASAQGRPLYEKKGFRVIDGVERWVLSASGPGSTSGGGESLIESLLTADAQVWGGRRSLLLSSLSEGGEVFVSGGTVALLQAGEDLRVLGPWLSADLCPRENRTVLTSVLESLTGSTEVVSDLLASSPVKQLLSAAGFERSGYCDLMVRGDARGVSLQSLVSFASLGSLG